MSKNLVVSKSIELSKKFGHIVFTETIFDKDLQLEVSKKRGFKEIMEDADPDAVLEKVQTLDFKLSDPNDQQISEVTLFAKSTKDVEQTEKVKK